MILESKPGRFRLSVIFAATARGLERFDSLDAMPPLLRARCLKALEGKDSGTVVIAGQSEAPPACAAEHRGAANAGQAAPASSRPARRARWAAAAIQVLAAALAAAAGWLLSRP